MNIDNPNIPILGQKKGPQVVSEVNYGVYVWRMPNGSYIADSDKRWLSIASLRGDIRRINQLQEAVKGYGIEEGTPEFIEGVRKVTDDEYDEQLERMEAGMIPDIYDIPAHKEKLAE